MIPLSNGLTALQYHAGTDKNNNFVITGATYADSISFVDIENVKVISDKSERTTWRKIHLLKKANGNQKIALPYYFELQGKYYVSALLFKKKEKRKKWVRNTISEEYIRWLKSLDWHLAGCVRYKKDMSLNTITNKMKSLFDTVNADSKGLAVLFYVLEKNPGNEQCYHAHFVINYGLDLPCTLMKRTIKHALTYNSRHYMAETWVRKYNRKKKYVEYMLNDLVFDEDGYDILHSQKLSDTI